MKNTFKKAMSWVLILTMLLSLGAAMAVGVGAETTTDLGKVGENITASYNSGSKTLTLTGSGAMYDYLDDGVYFIINHRVNAPWHTLNLTDQIQHVIVSQGITTIGNAAFYHLTACRDYSLPSTLVTIGEHAFANNTNLKSIIIPSSVRTVKMFSFHNSGLTTDGIRNSVCLGPTEILAPGTAANKELVNDLTDESLARVQITANGTLSSGITWMYSHSVKTLTISYTGTTPVAMPAFQQYGQDWVDYLPSIETLVVEGNITNIGAYALWNAEKLSSVTLSSAVTSIDAYAFAGCTSLLRLNLPAATKTIAVGAFGSRRGTDNSILLVTPNAQSVMEPGFTTTDNTYVTWSYGTQTNTPSVPSTTTTSGSIANGAIQWSYSSGTLMLSLASGYTTAAIPDYTAGGAPWSSLSAYITRVVIGSGITAIGDYAFYYLPSLQSVSLGSVQTISYAAFAYDTALQIIAFPSSVSTVEAYAFKGCSALIYATQANANMSVLTPNEELLRALNYNGSGSSGTDQSGTINQSIQWTYSSSSGTLSLSLASGYTTAAIPDYTAGNAPWSSLSSGIKRVIIGNGITAIGNYAFYNLPYLESITLSNSVSTIGSYSFAYASSLQMTAFPSSVVLVKANAFTGCSSLFYATGIATSVVALPNTELINALNYNSSGSVTPSTPSGNEISGVISGTSLVWSYNTTTYALNIRGQGAIPDFSTTSAAPWAAYASSISAITLHTGITSIGNNAFSNIVNVKDIYIPDTVKTIGENAFYGCTSLQTIRLPDGLSSMGEGVFRGCSSLITVDIPDGVTVIPAYAFYNCSSLESITLPENLVSIGKMAFYGCKKLSHIDLPASLTSIGEEAFYGCTGLTSVVIRSYVLNIGKNAFSGCNNIIKVVYLYNRPTAETGNESLTSKYVERTGSGTNGTISWVVDRADGTLTLTGTGIVSSKVGWETELPFVQTIIFGGEITGIGAGLLKGDQNVRHIIIGDSVKSIGDGAFEQCTGLETVTLPSSLESLGARVFYDCSSLKTIGLPDTIKQIPADAFGNCSALTSVDMSDNLVIIGEGAFRNCVALVSVEIPASVTTIEAGAFSYCTSLKKVKMYSGKLLPLSTGRFDNCPLSTVEYVGSASDWTTLTVNADSTIKNASVIYLITMTIHHVYKDGPYAGQVAAPTETISAAAGTTVTVETVVPYHSIVGAQSFVMPAQNSTQTIEYSPTKYTLTVKFVDSETGSDVALAKTYQLTYYEAKTISYNAATLSGYTPETTEVSIKAGEMTGDKTITIRCDKNSYQYTIEYVDSRTNTVFKTDTGTVKYGGSVSMTAPAVEGYTAKEPTKTYKLENVTADGGKISISYDPKLAKLTIRYVDMDGKQVAADYSADHYYGEKISIASPDVTGLTPDSATVSMDAFNGEQTVTVKYDWKYYTVTIHFLEADSIGYAIHDDYTTTVKHGSSFNFTLLGNEDYPTPDAYVAVNNTVKYETVTSDVEETILYNRKNFSLTVRYLDQEGNLLGSTTMEVPAGKVYTVPEKTIAGYLPADSLTGTMGVKDTSIDVTMELDPEADSTPQDETGGGVGRVIAVIAIIVLVLGAGGALFYFLYMKRT